MTAASFSDHGVPETPAGTLLPPLPDIDASEAAGARAERAVAAAIARMGPPPPLPVGHADASIELVARPEVLIEDRESARLAADAADASSDEPAVRVSGLTKSFSGHMAVEPLDLSIAQGTFFGLIGPNGAGKTTTLSMIAGLLRPDGGSVRVSGVDAVTQPREAARALGVVPDGVQTFDRLSGRQLLHSFAMLRGLTSDVAHSRMGDLSRAFDLVDALDRPVREYSTGMTKKVILAGAMIHSPRVLVLDEPFESVDPISCGIILDILDAYVAHGGTVILSSHGLELVEKHCSDIAVLVGGRLAAHGTVAEVRADRSLRDTLTELVNTDKDPEELEWLHTFSG